MKTEQEIRKSAFRKSRHSKHDYGLWLVAIMLIAFWLYYTVSVEYILIEHGLDVICEESPECCNGLALCDVVNWMAVFFLIEQMAIPLTIILGWVLE